MALKLSYYRCESCSFKSSSSSSFIERRSVCIVGKSLSLLFAWWEADNIRAWLEFETIEELYAELIELYLRRAENPCLPQKRGEVRRCVSDYYKIHLDTGAWSNGVLGCFCIDTCRAFYVKWRKDCFGRLSDRTAFLLANLLSITIEMR